ncbi:MAG: hypothetical protein NW223_03630 [Hyphomicrobiaceae bacterium]|nr:hypothetical protein [Hyphomicrobiaceae bacterium]
MSLQIVLDSSGDSRYVFDPAATDELAKARERFSRLTGRGFSAFDKQSGRRLGTFDPTVPETLFVPQLKGG